MTGEEYSFSEIQLLSGTPLKNKRLCVLGSSVMYGSASGGEAVPEYLARRHGCTVTKEAVSGTTLCDISPESYISRLKKLDTSVKYDLFFCQLSTNDATHSLPMGEIGDGDEKAVTGAVEEVIRYVGNTWSCPVIFIVGSRYTKKGCEQYDLMRRRLYELQKVYDRLYIIDLWESDEFNSVSDESRRLYMKDGIHPTKAGYSLWWGPEIDRQLLEICDKIKL